MFCVSFSCSEISCPFVYNQIHFHTQTPTMSEIAGCLRDWRGGFREDRRETGRRASPVTASPKCIQKNLFASQKSELWENLCWELRSKKGNKGTGGSAGLLLPRKSQSLVEIDGGSTTDSCCWDPHGWNCVLCRASRCPGT